MKERLLRVTTSTLCAGAIFQGNDCVSAAPILRWMVGKPASRIHLQLVKMGATWTWETLREIPDKPSFKPFPHPKHQKKQRHRRHHRHRPHPPIFPNSYRHARVKANRAMHSGITIHY